MDDLKIAQRKILELQALNADYLQRIGVLQKELAKMVLASMDQEETINGTGKVPKNRK